MKIKWEAGHLTHTRSPRADVPHVLPRALAAATSPPPSPSPKELTTLPIPAARDALPAAQRDLVNAALSRFARNVEGRLDQPPPFVLPPALAQRLALPQQPPQPWTPSLKPPPHEQWPRGEASGRAQQSGPPAVDPTVPLGFTGDLANPSLEEVPCPLRFTPLCAESKKLSPKWGEVLEVGFRLH